jgi:hypothetical protein
MKYEQKNIKKIKKPKSWFSDKINKIDRKLANLTNMRGENHISIKSEM